MFQIYASAFVALTEKLLELEKEADIWQRTGMTQQSYDRMNVIMYRADEGCEALDLTSAKKLIARMRAESAAGKMGMTYDEFKQMVTELRIRIKEDLQDKVFLCISERSKIERFFVVTNEEEYAPPTQMGILVPRMAHQLFHNSITARLEETSDDIIEACRSFVADRFTACVFHLMRVVEYGLLEVARLAEINDPKPSWGAILDRLEKLAHKTKFEDLPNGVKPHIDLIRELLPRMHAIQHAWRNRMIHVENKLIPTGGVTEEVANDVMNSVEIFMKTLVQKLPPRLSPTTSPVTAS
jgi:hypothetical protein